MSDEIYHLAYVSDAQLVDPCEAEPRELLEWQLKRILDAARSNNSVAGVTGALLFSGQHFAQVLEGPRAAINERYRRIAEDTRHNNVTPLLYEPAGERQFADWSMALCGAEEVDNLPDNFQVKPSPGSLEAGSLGRSIVASLAAAIGKRQTA